MTGKADFTQEEWDLILEGPPSAGIIVATAQRGGTFRESFAIGRAYVEARKQHGDSELLDEIVAAKPERDHTRYHSAEELKQAGLQHLRDAVGVRRRRKSGTTGASSSTSRTRSQTPTGREASRSATRSGRRSTRSRRVSALPTAKARPAPAARPRSRRRDRRALTAGPPAAGRRRRGGEASPPGSARRPSRRGVCRGRHRPRPPRRRSG